MSKRTDQTVAHYKLMQHLGTGSLGEIYAARDEETGKPVAIKLLSAYLSRLTEFRNRFVQEGSKSARLNHPAIIQVHRFGQHEYEDAGKDEQLYVVMDLVKGPSLAKALSYLQSTQRWLLPSEAIQIVRHVCMAVDYVNRLQALRRDYSPANIILTRGSSETLPYQPLLTDLGLKTLLGAARLSQSSLVMQALAYISPEELSGRQADARSDVFAIGVLLYELLIGSPPFSINKRSETYYQHSDEQRVLQEKLSALPQPIQQILTKALSKDPTHRQNTPGDVAAELGNYIRDANADDKTFFVGGENAVSLQSILGELEAVAPSGNHTPQPQPKPSNGQHAATKTIISVLKPDGTKQTVPLKTLTMSIGRAIDNDLILQNDDKISRYHAQVQLLADGYRVTDLGSENGIKLSGNKIPKDKAIPWRIKDRMQIGKHMLTLETDSLKTTPPSGGAVNQQIAVTTDSGLYTVDPGTSTKIVVNILNQSDLVAHFDIDVEGIPSAWWSADQPTVELLPRDEETITLTVTPPRASQSKAQEYPLKIQAASQKTLGLGAKQNAMLHVTPFYEFGSSLYPTRIRTRRDAKVTIENQGNTTQSFNLTWKDDSGALRYMPPDGKITIQGGDTGVVPFRAYPNERRWYGPEENYQLTIDVTPSHQPDDKKTLQGYVHSSTLISIPMIMGFILLVAALFGLQRAFPPTVTSSKVRLQNPAAGTPMELQLETENVRWFEVVVDGGVPEDIPREAVQNILSGTPYLLKSELATAEATPEVVIRAHGWFPFSKSTAIASIATPDPLAPVIESFDIGETEFTAGEEERKINFTWQVSNVTEAIIKIIADDGEVNQIPVPIANLELRKFPLEIPQKPGTYQYQLVVKSETGKEVSSEEKTVSVEDPILIVQNNGVTFRNGNSTNHTEIKRLQPGDRLRALAKPSKGGWIYAKDIDDAGEVGWVKDDFVTWGANLTVLESAPSNSVLPTPVPPTPEPTPTAPPPLPGAASVAGGAAAVSGNVATRGSAPGNVAPVPQAKPEKPRKLDPRLELLGVGLEEATVSPESPYWRLVEVKWENEKEAGGKHNIYVTTLDEKGERVIDIPVEVFWADGKDVRVTEEKQRPDFEDEYSDYMFDFNMFSAGWSYNVKIADGSPTDILRGAGLGSIEQREFTIHTNFLLTFQKTIK